LVTGLCSFFFSSGILAVQIAAIGHIFRQLMGIPYHIGIFIGFSIVLFYATAGGAASVIAIDRLQFVILMTGIPLLIFFGVQAAGGVSGAAESLPPSHFNLTLSGGVLAGLFFSLMVGEALNPPYIQRMFAGKGAKTLARATVITAVLSVPFFILTGSAGLLMHAIDSDVPASMAMPALILRVMPPILRGVVISAMLAIVMSSADTILTAAAVGLSQDTLLPILNRNPTPEKRLRIIRLTNALTGIVAMTVALLHNDVFKLLIFSYRFWAPVIVAPLIGALWGCKTKPAVFYMSAISGGLASLLWSDAALNVAVGFAVSAVVFIAGARLCKYRIGGC
jgi:SSS family solute:Na+ symporter